MKRIEDIKVDLVNSKWLSFNEDADFSDQLFESLSHTLKSDEVVYSIVTGNILLKDKQLEKDTKKLAKLQEKQVESNEPISKDMEMTMNTVALEVANVREPGQTIVCITDSRIITVYQDLNKGYKTKVLKKHIEDIVELNASEDPDDNGWYNFDINYGRQVIKVVTQNVTNIKHFEFTLDQLIEIEAQKQREEEQQKEDEEIMSEPMKKDEAKKATSKTSTKKSNSRGNDSFSSFMNQAWDTTKAWFKKTSEQAWVDFKKFDWIWLIIAAVMGAGMIITSAIMYGTDWQNKYWIPAAALELVFAVIGFVFVLIYMLPKLKEEKHFDYFKGFQLVLFAFIFIVSAIALSKQGYDGINFIEYIITIMGIWMIFDNVYPVCESLVKKLAKNNKSKVVEK